MGLDFLHAYGAHRLREDIIHPPLFDESMTGDNVNGRRDVDLNYEQRAEAWHPINVRQTVLAEDWKLRPKRFIDGKDLGRTVAWLQTQEAYPIPVRLSEIGAVVMRHTSDGLFREWCRVERVVSMIIDPFPWDEIESFASALQEKNFRLLPCKKPQGRLTYDFQEMRKATQNRSMDEMMRLEKQGLVFTGNQPVLIDGRLRARWGGFNEEQTPVVGMIKDHSAKYLHDYGWQVYFRLDYGERTPAFLLNQEDLRVISWYVRIDGSAHDLPNGGVIRLEIPEKFFRLKLGGDSCYLDQLSRLICEYRCRDRAYKRASTSLYPIQRAEESLGSLFQHPDAFTNHFYKLTRL